jgi:hypothetical protein
MPSESDWRWKLRLFVSADLVGSTAYKASQSEKSSPIWASTFKEFFREFPATIEAQYAKLPDKHVDCNHHFKPWKFLGDEILFSVELRKFQESVSHIWVFKDAISEFPKSWARKNVPLSLKATAWLAGFPVTNTEIEIQTETGNSLDFIGPSIDLGFRIARYSESRKFVLSADLALMVLDAIHDTEIHDGKYQLILHGREALKGVIGNQPYPITWIDMRDGDPEVEEELLGVSHTHIPNKLTDYLRRFIDSSFPKLRRPFIDGDPHEKYGHVPEDLRSIREQMQAEESDRGFLDPGAQPDPAPSGPPRQPDEPQPTQPE